jgi:hypothetical protein
LLAEREGLSEVLGSPVTGIRQHYFRLMIPETWRRQEEAGYLYDSSLFFPNRSGFRAGTGYPFIVFDATSGRQLDLIEIPVEINDSTLFSYEKLDVERARGRCRELIDQAANYSDLLTVQWHLRMADQVDHPGLFDLYAFILNYAKEKHSNVWITNCADLVQWWKDRENIILSERTRSISEVDFLVTSQNPCKGLSIWMHIPNAKRIEQIKSVGKEGDCEIKLLQAEPKRRGLDVLFSLDVTGEEQVRILYK